SGSYFSYFTMLLLLRFGHDKFSYIGISLAGSIMHNIGQILVLILAYSAGIMGALIWLIPLGVATGMVVGTIFTALKRYLDKGEVFKRSDCKTQDPSHRLQDLLK